MDINTIYQQNQGQHRHDYVGDKLRKKSKHCIRIFLNNINGLTGPSRIEKIEKIKEKSFKYKPDILFLVEVRQNLRRIPLQHRLKAMTNGWWQHNRIHQTFNAHFDSNRQDQVGGTSIMITDRLAHHRVRMKRLKMKRDWGDGHLCV